MQTLLFYLKEANLSFLMTSQEKGIVHCLAKLNATLNETQTANNWFQINALCCDVNFVRVIQNMFVTLPQSNGACFSFVEQNKKSINQ